MGFLDRLFGRRRRDAGNGTTASTTPPVIYPDTGSGTGRDEESREEGSIDPSAQEIQVGESEPSQDVDVGDSGGGDSGGGDGGGGNGGGGNGGGGGE